MDIEAKDLWGSFKGVLEDLGFFKAWKNFVQRENEGGSKEGHIGGMKKCKKR